MAEPRKYRNPTIRALEWQKIMEDCSLSRAGLARKLGVSRARVTQVLAVLPLAPEIQEYLLALSEESDRGFITGRALRQITRVRDHDRQLQGFRALLRQTDYGRT